MQFWGKQRLRPTLKIYFRYIYDIFQIYLKDNKNLKIIKLKIIELWQFAVLGKAEASAYLQVNAGLPPLSHVPIGLSMIILSNYLFTIFLSINHQSTTCANRFVNQYLFFLFTNLLSIYQQFNTCANLFLIQYSRKKCKLDTNLNLIHCHKTISGWL